jgi:outer membrane protein TolC
VDSSLAGARTQLVAARASLAETMGIDVASLEGMPIASEKFSDAHPTLASNDALIAHALAERRDVRVRQNQIAAAAHWMLSEHSSFMVGSVLSVDGGTDALVRPDTF